MKSDYGPARIGPDGADDGPGWVTFWFEERELQARTGEPVAAALLASGQRVFRTMPRSGEPRGGFCFAGRCSDCLMVIDGQPGRRACITPVQAGMRVARQRGHGEPWQGDGA